MSNLQKMEIMEGKKEIRAERKHGLGIRTDLSSFDIKRAILENLSIEDRKSKRARIGFNKSSDELMGNKENSSIKDNVIIFFEENLDAQKMSEQEKNSIRDIAKQSTTVDNWTKRYSFSTIIDHKHLELCNINIIYVKNNLSSNENISVKRILQSNSFNHTIIIVGDDCDIKLLMQSMNSENSAPNSLHSESSNQQPASLQTSNSMMTDFTEIFLGENSKLEYSSINDTSDSINYYCKSVAHCKKNATLKHHAFDCGSKILIRDALIRLEGNNSGTFADNIYMAEHGKNYDIYTIIEHIGKDTQSFMKNSGSIKKSKVITRGLVKIGENAFNSNGYQRSDALMLDNESRAISIPDLEIYNDQVKCTHASSISRIDDEKIFYLQSRGLNAFDAQKVMLKGFYAKSVEKVSEEPQKIILDMINANIDTNEI